MANHKPTLLVTGVSGHLGRRVVELLLEQGAGPLVVTTRSPDKVADLAARGVTVRRADFEDPASLTDAFRGVDRALLISTDALDRPGRRLAQHRNAVAAARQAGVSHLVYTSLPEPGPDSPIVVAADHRGTEEAIVASGLSHTILRNHFYADLLLFSLPRAVQTGELVAAAGDGASAYVTRDDCARAAAAALASTFAGTRVLDVSGPAAITHAELATITSNVTGRPVRYVPIPADALRAGMIAAGLPEGVADLYVSFDVGTARGFLAGASTAVADLTGTPPTPLASFLAANRAALLG
jgi:NAD(P)H dehydrogenase (quinone)